MTNDPLLLAAPVVGAAMRQALRKVVAAAAATTTDCLMQPGLGGNPAARARAALHDLAHEFGAQSLSPALRVLAEANPGAGLVEELFGWLLHRLTTPGIVLACLAASDEPLWDAMDRPGLRALHDLAPGTKVWRAQSVAEPGAGRTWYLDRAEAEAHPGNVLLHGSLDGGHRDALAVVGGTVVVRCVTVVRAEPHMRGDFSQPWAAANRAVVRMRQLLQGGAR